MVANPGVIPDVLSASNFRIPDLGVTCTPDAPGQIAIANPVLLVEVLSPSKQAETRANVWACTSIPSVQEILILRADRIGAELLRRGADGRWPERALLIETGELVLESIGFRTQLAPICERTQLSQRRPET